MRAGERTGCLLVGVTSRAGKASQTICTSSDGIRSHVSGAAVLTGKGALSDSVVLAPPTGEQHWGLPCHPTTHAAAAPAAVAGAAVQACTAGVPGKHVQPVTCKPSWSSACTMVCRGCSEAAATPSMLSSCKQG